MIMQATLVRLSLSKQNLGCNHFDMELLPCCWLLSLFCLSSTLQFLLWKTVYCNTVFKKQLSLQLASPGFKSFSKLSNLLSGFLNCKMSTSYVKLCTDT
jgi:hypothetical protein